MRPRHEIRETWIMSDDDNQTGVLLEVLLDIRDLLVDLYNRDADVKIDYGDKPKV